MDVTDALFEAVLARDATFDGIYYIGIRTTRIVCFPSCHSRIPKRQNIVVFSDVASAVAHGYRPCKRCRPDADIIPPERELARRAEALLQAHFPTRLTLKDAALMLHVSERQLSRTLRRSWAISWHTQFDRLWLHEVKALLMRPDLTVPAIATLIGVDRAYFSRRFRRLNGYSPAQYRNGEGKS